MTAAAKALHSHGRAAERIAYTDSVARCCTTDSQ